MKISQGMIWAILIVLVLALFTVGTMDYNDRNELNKHNLEMVCSGAWPDYNGTKKDCHNE